jgi:hypothetical protein
MWIFSDGRWSARDRAATSWRADHLKHVVVWVFDETAPEPPHPAMRIVTAPTLAALIEKAPRYFWEPAHDGAGSLAAPAGAAAAHGSR